MQVASPTPIPAAHTLSPARPAPHTKSFGSPEARSSPSRASPRRLRRSLRLSGASASSPQQSLNKENIGVPTPSWPSTSAKTLDFGSSEDDKRSSPRLSLPHSSSPTLQSSPLRSRSSPIRLESPLRRSLRVRSDDIDSSSDDSDDSALVFFGKPSSAEKKKRIHYEQRVLEKRLKHKDSLDLARRRPISFNPDDTMLIDDQHAYGWSWSKPTPTPSRPAVLSLTSPTRSLPNSESPTLSRASARILSPDHERRSSNQDLLDDHRAIASDSTRNPEQLIASSVASPEGQKASASAEKVPETPQEKHTVETTVPASTADTEDSVKPATNPFVAAQSSPAKESAPNSPSTHRRESPQRAQSPVRSVETLIGATMAHNRELASPIRSPRRSPRLSLRALQLSTSPVKSNPSGLFFGPSTPFQQNVASKHVTPFQHSTPFQQPQLATAQQVPPSTGLSRFACLQNMSPISRMQATPSNQVLPMRLAQHAVQPSPFIWSSVPASSAADISLASEHDSPSRSRIAETSAPNPARSPAKQFSTDAGRRTDTLNEPRSVSPSKVVPTPGTPSVRFAVPESQTSPIRKVSARIADSPAAGSTSPAKALAQANSPMPLTGASLQPQILSSPLRGSARLTTSPTKPVELETLPESPGPVFRQTARRVPIQQHEAEFGVKVSPAKPSYSPRKAYANSSARTNDFGAKPERVPARRVPIQPTAAARQASAKHNGLAASGAMRIASVASKATRSVSVNVGRIGGQSTSLAAAALSRTASSASGPSSVSIAATATTAPAPRIVTSAQGSSVASKASRLQRPASASLGNNLSSPSKQPRSLSGLPRPKSASTTSATSIPGPATRLPRPATLGSSASTARTTSRPTPMAIARLAPAQPRHHAAVAGSANPKPQVSAGIGAAVDEDAPDVSTSVPSAPMTQAEVSAEVQSGLPGSVMEEVARSDDDRLAADTVEGRALSAAPRERASAATGKTSSTSAAHAKAPSGSGAQTSLVRSSKLTGNALQAEQVRSSSPVKQAPADRLPSLSRPAPPVVLDAEQQRLRCLAMQEKARNRAPKSGPSASAPTSSDVEELPAKDADGRGSSPVVGLDEQSPTAGAALSKAPEAGGVVTAKSASSSLHQGASTTAGTALITANTSTAVSSTSAGRPLRSARAAARPLSASATRVPPSRGRALSLNDIIAARKIDVPLSLTDQLKLADTVNKKLNEKTLARYKITKTQRPYERPPSPERHDHEPEACTIIDDLSSHRQGKGDIAPYSTPVKRPASSGQGSSHNAKCVRWYRPLFVGQGSQYGTKACASRPALKPVQYELDRMGNKVATGDSPKLSKGQSIVIYRNYFKGEPEPADD